MPYIELLSNHFKYIRKISVFKHIRTPSTTSEIIRWTSTIFILNARRLNTGSKAKAINRYDK